MKTLFILTFLFSFQAWGDRGAHHDSYGFERDFSPMSNNQPCHTHYINTMNRCKVDYGREFNDCSLTSCFYRAGNKRERCENRAYKIWRVCSFYESNKECD